MQNIVFFAEVLNRTKEALRILNESYNDAQRHSALKHLAAAEPDHRGNGDGGQHFNDGIIDGMRHNGIFVCVHVLRVNIFKLLVGALLPIEQLQHYHPRDVLLQMSVDARNGQTDPAIRITNFFAEDHRRPED